MRFFAAVLVSITLSIPSFGESFATLLPDPSQGSTISPVGDISTTTIPRAPEVSAVRQLEMLRTEMRTQDDLKLRGGVGESVYNATIGTVVIVFGESGHGAGAVIDPRGLVVTNWHVVEDSKTVGLKLYTTKSGVRNQAGFVGEVIAIDKSKDLALVRFRTTPPNLKSASLGNMRDVRIGMDVHAIGHPVDEMWTYTSGVVSQIRTNYRWQYSDESDHTATVIQTQTPINPGNSGGPLFSDKGKLVGINSFGSDKYEGINFAVAVSELEHFLEGKSTSTTGPKNETLPEPLSRYADWEKDTDGDGRTELYGFDTDDNGTLDLYAVDDDSNDKADHWLLDLNENRTPDGTVVHADTLEAGAKGYVWFFDSDENEETELMGRDYDGDGKIDRFIPL